MTNEANEFIGVKIAKDEKRQQLQLVCKDGTKKVFMLKDFPYIVEDVRSLRVVSL